jgi:hypothetical protein
LYLLREIWGNAGFCEGPLYGYVNNAKKVPQWISFNPQVNIDNKNGLYFLFLPVQGNLNGLDINDIHRQNHIIPFYVGITGDSFRGRFDGHHNSLQKFSKGTAIVGYFVVMPLHVAKFYESLFLSLFDFAKNIAENNKERNIDQRTTFRQSVANGISIFKKRYDSTKRYFMDIEQIISWVAGHTYNLAHRMLYYQ